MLKLDLEKAEEPEIKLPTSCDCWIIEKARELQKNIYFCFIDYAKAFDCVITTNWKILKEDGNTRPSYLLPEKPVHRSSSKLELNMEQWTGSKLGKKTLLI